MNKILPYHLVVAMMIFDEIPDYPGFVKVFADAGAPTVDSSFKTIDQGTIRTHYKFDELHSYHSYVPLSTSFYDTSYHQVMINHDIISVIKNAAGNRGTFLHHIHSYHNGFLSYIGKKSRSAQSQPSQSEGLQNHFEEHGFWYYKNTINLMYWPKTLHVFNHIARSGSHVA